MHSIQILSLSLLSLLHPIVRTADIGVRMSTNATSPWCNPTREHKTQTSAHTRDGLASDGVNKHQVCRDDDNHNNENANVGMENGTTRGGAHHVEWRCRGVGMHASGGRGGGVHWWRSRRFGATMQEVPWWSPRRSSLRRSPSLAAFASALSSPMRNVRLCRHCNHLCASSDVGHVCAHAGTEQAVLFI